MTWVGVMVKVTPLQVTVVKELIIALGFTVTVTIKGAPVPELG
jgi:hypothetical protein